MRKESTPNRRGKMKMMKDLFLLALLILSVNSIVNAQERKRIPDSTLNRLLKGSGEGNHGWPNVGPYYIKLNSDPEYYSPGEVILDFIYSPRTDCKDFKITISEIDKIEILGNTVLQSNIGKEDTVVLRLNVRIPPNDTCGFKYELNYCGQIQEWYRYFISTDDAVHETSVNLSKAASSQSKRQRPENPYLRFVRPVSFPVK
ncbi:MAG: hypothetical protein ACREBV_06995 [Candidatus Zixiibacteriota bacterium]